MRGSRDRQSGTGPGTKFFLTRIGTRPVGSKIFGPGPGNTKISGPGPDKIKILDSDPDPGLLDGL